MKTVTTEQLLHLQNNPQNIRNVCILAHVDHGKTTLADSVLASNGVISQRMAGKLRYMDSRKDEQERGITMKCSSVSIHHKIGEEEFLINLIDSPGHVDFYGEVSTAVRLCDGAILVVDVIEGVCAQTKIALRQAWSEYIHPILVLNKIDRLILERMMTPLDACIHLQQILEQVNAVTAELFTSNVIEKSDAMSIQKEIPEKEISSEQLYDWSSGIDDTDDSTVYFSPDQNNVIFASALDGWGFGIAHFAKLYAKKLGIKEDILKKTLWGDYYLNSKSKRIMKGAQAKAKKPLFAQFVLENIWAVYDAIITRRDKQMAEKIVNSLGLKIALRDARHTDPKIYLQAVFNQWLPLANAVCEIVCRLVPSPLELSSERAEHFICTNIHRFDRLPAETRELKKDFVACSSTNEAPIIVCISKMFPVEKSLLPHNKLRPLTSEEIALRRETARRQHAERLAANQNKINETHDHKVANASQDTNSVCTSPQDDVTFIAFARVFSGILQKGKTVYVLGPKHDPTKVIGKEININKDLTLKDLPSDQHITIATIGDIYLLMGKEMEPLESAAAGSVVGIAGLDEHILKSATLSTTIACPPFIDLQTPIIPILRVALEPVYSNDMPSLIQGLRLLNQADPCVQVLIQATGEHVIVTAGEVHLQRCLDDLRERFAKVEINVSSPIVPFRETIVPHPKTDMVNEIIEGKDHIKKTVKAAESGEWEEDKTDGLIIMQTPNKSTSVSIRALSLPEDVTKLLEDNCRYIKELHQTICALRNGQKDSVHSLRSETLKIIEDLKNKLQKAFSEAGPEWENAIDQIWSFGPRRCGPNILLNRISEYDHPPVWLQNHPVPESIFSQYESSFVSGFQLATLAGPLCQEPMMGVCFVVENWEIENSSKHFNDCDNSILLRNCDTKSHFSECDLLNNVEDTMLQPLDIQSGSGELELLEMSGISNISNNTPYGPISGQIMSIVKEGCRRAFQSQPQRLLVAMYSCNIQVATDMLGKMYAVLGRRHGRVLHGDLQTGTQTFNVTAVIPIVESFEFANEIRKQTSGMACPQLLFSHWDVLDIDPFWVPTTEEEYMHFGEKADTENRARKYMNNVRRRKGLAVDEKIVEHAEKQRTLTRNK